MAAYPANVLEDAAGLTALLGSFWSRDYGGRDEVEAICGAVGAAGSQLLSDLEEAAACLSYDGVPVCHVEEWTLVYVRESSKYDPTPNSLYGDGGVYGGASTYGRSPSGVFAADAPAGLARAPMIFNRMSSPSASLCDGVDYRLDGGLITLRDDPFAGGLFAVRPVFDVDGVQVDREAALWLFRAEFDSRYIHRHYGVVLGLNLPSSAAYRDAVAASLAALVQGPSELRILDLLSAAFGAPLAGGDEVVQAVAYDARGPLVITDVAAHRCPPRSSPVVFVGDRLAAGDRVCNAFSLVYFNRGLSGPAVAIPQLVLGEGFLPASLRGGLAFVNEYRPVRVYAGPGGETRLEFAVAGPAESVRAFWEATHAAGVATGRTLARALDRRPAGTPGEPTAADLPAVVNPMEFVVSNLLRGCVAVTVEAAATAPDAPGVSVLRLLRRLSSPRSAILLLVKAAPIDGDDVSPDAGGLDSFLAAPPIDGDDEPDPSADGPIAAKIVDGCY